MVHDRESQGHRKVRVPENKRRMPEEMVWKTRHLTRIALLQVILGSEVVSQSTNVHP